MNPAIISEYEGLQKPSEQEKFMLQPRRKRITRLAITCTAVTAMVAGTTTLATAGSFTGPSTKVPSYLIPSATGVDLTSLLTVGDKAAGNGYKMVGIPDGLGAYKQGNNTIVLMNHELGADKGIVRAHGQEGSFVSKYVISPNGKVISGSDLIQTVNHYNYANSSYSATPGNIPGGTTPFDARFGRFCSSTLSEANQFFNSASGKGTRDRLYFANEEQGNESRVFGVTMNGTAVQLPRLGLFSWENTIPAPNTSDTTTVIGTEDGSAGQVWVYAGTKQRGARGRTVFDKAGLTNGTNHVVAISDGAGGHYATDAAFRAAKNKGDSVAFDLAEVDWNQSGADQNADAASAGTALNRVEDGAWDPQNPNDFYFLTTDGGEGSGNEGGGGGLWRMSFADIENPAAGGTITLLLDGTESIALNKPDNMVIDSRGNLLIQEDPGNVNPIARIVAYRISDGAMGAVATFDPNLFTPGASNFLTKDEESSGIIDMESLGYPAGTFFLDAQVHTSTGLPADPSPTSDNAGTVDEFVEHGQLLKMFISDFSNVYTIFPNV
jgi:hypothetical protein